jgi:hypothetical protein
MVQIDTYFGFVIDSEIDAVLLRAFSDEERQFSNIVDKQALLLIGWSLRCVLIGSECTIHVEIQNVECFEWMSCRSRPSGIS